MKRVVMITCGLLVALAALSTPAVAQTNNTTNISEKAPYYADENAQVDNESWLEGNRNATLENTTTWVTRLGSFVIGTKPGSSQDEAAGALLVGLLMFGLVLGSIGPNRVGFVAGSTMGSATIAGLVISGLAPEWLWAVVLFVIGIVATAAFFRVYR